MPEPTPDLSVHLQTLPLFPLQLVLYPDGVLPLRIFEVRYLDLIGRAHREGKPFGVVSLIEGRDTQQPAAAPGSAAYADEHFHDIGTLATITHLERPQPGLMVIRCVGTQRFRLASRQRLKHGLWTGSASLLEADAPIPVPPDLAAASDTLRALLAQLQLDADAGEAPAFHRPYRWTDCGWVANRWCELLPLPALMKQQLLQTDSPLLRLELVADVLDQVRRRGGLGGPAPGAA